MIITVVLFNSCNRKRHTWC